MTNAHAIPTLVETDLRSAFLLKRTRIVIGQRLVLSVHDFYSKIGHTTTRLIQKMSINGILMKKNAMKNGMLKIEGS